MKTKLSMKESEFILFFRKYLNVNHSTFDNFFINFKRLYEEKLSNSDFIKITTIMKYSNLQILELMDLHKTLSEGSQFLNLKQLKQKYEIHTKQIPDQNIQESRRKKMQNALKQLSDKNKLFIKMTLKKLFKYIAEEGGGLQIFDQFDEDYSDGLDVMEFNKLLIASNITQLKDKNSRILFLRYFYMYYPMKIISRDQFQIFFKLPARKRIKRKLTYEQKPPIQPMKKKNQILQITNITQEPINPKIQQENYNLNSQKYLEKFPNAFKHYRLGIPSFEENQILNKLENLLKYDTIYIDKENPKTLGNEQYCPSSQIFQTKYYLFQVASSVFVRQKSRMNTISQQIEPKDIKQGNLGDCYFLSSLASLVYLYPQVISDKFILSENKSKFYAVKLFINGEWKIFETDDSFPCQKQKPTYTKPHGNQIWVMLIEKCWAKAYKGYFNIISGTPRQAIQALTGCPSKYVKVDPNNIEKHQKQLFQAFQNKKVIMTSGSDFLQKLSEGQKKKIGLVANHSYSFLKIFKIKQSLIVKLRNPWGHQIWNGKWSFKSAEWTKQLRQRCNYNKQPQDGSFYMPWDQFMLYFGTIYICNIQTTFKHTSFRMVNHKRKSNYIKMKIREDGEYSLSIYQESKRMYKNDKINYQYSRCRIIILKKQQNGFLTYCGSFNSNLQQVCMVSCKLVKGTYIISAKVFWQLWEKHECVLTAYGTEQVQFQPISRQIAQNFKKSMIQSYSEKTDAPKKYYTNLQGAYKITDFSLPTGLGFIKVMNPTLKCIIITIQFTKKRGIKIIKPAILPLQIKIKPNDNKIVGFFTDSKGFQYSLSETVSLQ